MPSAGAIPILIALFVAEVLAWSGGAKATRVPDVALALARFRVTKRPRPTAARLLVAGELLLAVSLAAASFALRGLLAAVLAAAGAVFASFLVVIVRSMRRGESFPCMCFGSTEDTLTALTGARAAALCVICGAGVAVTIARPVSELPAQDLVSGASICAALLGLLVLIPAAAPLRARLDPFDFSDPGSLAAAGLPSLEGR
ncbi:MAG TPA: MauE/DoxX family redox-associated membrane protein [Gaiellaceae bacterium]|nr:MauE/DoxX family redox-associated membrane protein [Gaiellaceae bacterium]